MASKKAPKVVLIPFIKETRELVAWDYKRYEDEELEWKENFEFDATLAIDSFVHGRSGFRVKFRLSDSLENPQDVYFLMSDTVFAELAQSHLINRGVVRGTWTFRKRGEYYSIIPVVTP